MVYRVNVNPEMLKWARIDAGYDTTNLPKNIRNKLQDWENGNVKPTWNQVMELSNQYKRPSALFFLTQPPEHETVDLIEYRKIDNFTIKKSPKLTLGLREVTNKRNIYLELLDDMRIPHKSFVKNRFETKNSTIFAQKIRELLNISLDEQKSWIYTNNNKKDLKHYKFLNEWKEQISELGVLIFEISHVLTDEMRALSIYKNEYPIILLNGADSVNGRIFSLFHELTHLMLGESAICDLDRKNSKERFCNRVAAEFLVPSEDFSEKEEMINHSYEWEDNELSALSHEYGVSNESILLRLLFIKKTTQNFYDYKKGEWESRTDNSNESSGGSPVLNQIKYNGKMFSRLVFAAYENNIISPVDFSNYVGLRLKHVNKLEEYLFG